MDTGDTKLMFDLDCVLDDEPCGADAASVTARLAEVQTDLRSTVADLKAAHGGKAIAETAAFFLLEVVKHADPVRYAEALRHWPFLDEAKGERDES